MSSISNDSSVLRVFLLMVVTVVWPEVRLFSSTPPLALASGQLLTRERTKQYNFGRCDDILTMKKNIPTPAFQNAQDGHFEVVAAGKVDDEVGGGVEDERKVVEAGQAEDPWVDMA